MKVILLKDIENLGKKYDVKEVKDGYARNFLIPKGFVKLATNKALKQLEIEKEIEEKRAEEELKKIQDLASQVDGLEVIIPVKVGEKEQFFEKINAQKIVEKLRELGFAIKKDQIELSEPIEELGEFPVKIKFSHNLESEIRLIITEEEKK
jgi:large subunit ribosomal protein L9